MSEEKKSVWINIRLTPAMLEKIKHEARFQCRSLAGQALYIIEQYFKFKEK